MQTERVTRSRARTHAATGETPALAALPDKTPAGTARMTRRWAAAAAATAPAAAAMAPHAGCEVVAPVVLFDVTNEQVEPAAPAVRPESPEPAVQQQQVAGDEPPATPAQAVPASPAPPASGTTPTGLGLSSMQPLSPLMTMPLHSKTPTATPLGGAAADHGKVVSALHAAAQALAGSPTTAGQQQQLAEPDLLFRGFGSPLKQGAASPDAAPLSIGATIAATSPAGVLAACSGAVAGTGVEATATSGTNPGPAGLGCGERELTLEEVMGTPWPTDHRETSEEPTPTFQPTPLAHPVASATALAVTVRTVQKAHPLTPARQVVLEEEEQDYVMKVGEVVPAAAGPPELAAQDEDMQSVAEAPAEGAEVLPVAKPRLASKVVVPSPGMFDPRSLRQLKRAVADRLAAKQAGALLGAGGDYEEEEEAEGEAGYIGTTAVDDELADELGALRLGTGTHGPLRGVPTPAGSHIRFGDDGEVAATSPRQKVFLRGMPQPQGNHLRFD